MTATSDPFHPAYFDDADLHAELERTHSVCLDCRACVERCGVFPSLFALTDAAAAGTGAPASRAQQNAITEQCFDCGLCTLECPDAPGRGGHDIDHAALMRRAREFRVRNHEMPLGARLAGAVRSATVRVGRVVGGRRDMVGTRFSTWFRGRTAPPSDGLAGSVAIFPTCIVEHSAPELGRALVEVLEHNGVTCHLPEGLQCCGAPLLQQGDIDGFVAQGRRNVRVLADAVRAGHDIVSPQPTCTRVLTHDYVAYVGGSDAEMVADHTREATDHLLGLHHDPETSLRTDLVSPLPASVTLHAPCHLRTQQVGEPAAELLRLMGSSVTVVAACAGSNRNDGPGGEVRTALRRTAARQLVAASADAVAGECHAADSVLSDALGRPVEHPLILLARAYGSELG